LRINLYKSQQYSITNQLTTRYLSSKNRISRLFVCFITLLLQLGSVCVLFLLAGLIICIFVLMKSKKQLNLILLIVFSIQLISSQKTNMKKPEYLQNNDTIAIVAPAGIIKNEIAIYQAKELAESWGLHVLIGDNVFSKKQSFCRNRSTTFRRFSVGIG
jgi:hypothetical protein